jgi:hypothetical protein
MDAHDTEFLKYFTERRLRPLTQLASDDDKIRKFNEMKNGFEIMDKNQIEPPFAIKSSSI